MRQSLLVSKSSREIAKEEVSINAQLLTRAGFINRLMAGVYSYLPLGIRVLTKIENIIREEMNRIGAQEILMPALQPKEIWDQTGRWDKVDVLFKFKGQGDRELTLGPTHEEVVTPLIGSFLYSYRDLPAAVCQIQTKFRNEARAKSGLLRGREFRMKDMYSFHLNSEDLDRFYEQAIGAYNLVFERCGLGPDTLITAASGGVFSPYSHEFQTVTEFGEDLIFRVPGEKRAINKEIINDPKTREELIPKTACGQYVELEEVKAIEVGNIFKLGTRFSEAFGIQTPDAGGAREHVHMGCYGMGTSRIMGAVVERFHDEKGILWPDGLAPYDVHVISLAREAKEMEAAEAIVEKLEQARFEVLFDDRAGVQAGEKFADSDLIGIPNRVVVSKKTLASQKLEFKRRDRTEVALVSVNELIASLMTP